MFTTCRSLFHCCSSGCQAKFATIRCSAESSLTAWRGGGLETWVRGCIRSTFAWLSFCVKLRSDWEVLDTFLVEASGISLKGVESEGNRSRLEHTLLSPSMITPPSRSWPPEGDDMFRIALGRLFQSMRLREMDHFLSLLDETRLQVPNICHFYVVQMVSCYLFQ